MRGVNQVLTHVVGRGRMISIRVRRRGRCSVDQSEGWVRRRVCRGTGWWGRERRRDEMMSRRSGCSQEGINRRNTRWRVVTTCCCPRGIRVSKNVVISVVVVLHDRNRGCWRTRVIWVREIVVIVAGNTRNYGWNLMLSWNGVLYNKKKKSSDSATTDTYSLDDTHHYIICSDGRADVTGDVRHHQIYVRERGWWCRRRWWHRSTRRTSIRPEGGRTHDIHDKKLWWWNKNKVLTPDVAFSPDSKSGVKVNGSPEPGSPFNVRHQLNNSLFRPTLHLFPFFVRFLLWFRFNISHCPSLSFSPSSASLSLSFTDSLLSFPFVRPIHRREWRTSKQKRLPLWLLIPQVREAAERERVQFFLSLDGMCMPFSLTASNPHMSVVFDLSFYTVL